MPLGAECIAPFQRVRVPRKRDGGYPGEQMPERLDVRQVSDIIELDQGVIRNGSGCLSPEQRIVAELCE